MNYAEPFIRKTDLITSFIVAIASYILGEHWYLFAGFLALNIADWLTGWIKSRIKRQENSTKGWKGVLKKLSYWIMIAVAFGMSAIFINLGEVLGINLHVTTLLGWFVLASLFVNELRSILENFVEAGLVVPHILVEGLEVADKLINDQNSEESEEQ